MKIAMTGATGFLGRYIVRHLAGAGHRLRCWYRDRANWSGFNDVTASVERLPGELGDPVAVQEVVGGTIAVVRAAAQWQRPRNRESGGHGAADFFSGSISLASRDATGIPQSLVLSGGTIRRATYPK